MKAKSLIAILLGGLIMVIIGHDVIPHHHHAGISCQAEVSVETCLHQEEHSCETGHEHDNCISHSHDHGDHHGHCHAFNELNYITSFEKSFVPQPEFCNVIIGVLLPDETGKPSESENYRNRSGPVPDPFPGYLGASSGLRAPPLCS